MRAELTLTPASWGTRLDWSCSYPAGVWEDGATYELVLVDDDGTRSVVATWSSTEAGSSSGLGASSAVPVDGIARLELGVVGWTARSRPPTSDRVRVARTARTLRKVSGRTLNQISGTLSQISPTAAPPPGNAEATAGGSLSTALVDWSLR